MVVLIVRHFANSINSFYTGVKSSKPWLANSHLLRVGPELHSFFAPSSRYATTSGTRNTSKSSRRSVTVANDDGRVQWQDLSIGEKAARTTQQTFNFGLVLAGFAGTVRFL